ncbi:MAG: YDG domain-containing protein [Microscillaceae bacterium]|jgi:hypothetical protein|nr:YDG domain-containing protein [Microscillaceae bacterium]
MRKLYLFLLLGLFCQVSMAQTPFWQDSFENATTPDVAAGSTRATSVAQFGCGGPPFTRYFRRSLSSEINTNNTYTNVAGSYFWASEDNDFGSTCTNNSQSSAQSITWSSINISSKTNIQFKGLIGGWDPGTGGSVWEDVDYLQVEYRIDGGAWAKIIAFACNLTGGLSGQMLLDADFNGVGEGTPISHTLTEYTRNITGTGSLMDLRITMATNSIVEEYGIDNFRLVENIPAATITTSGTLSALSTTYGTASSNTTFTVAGTGLSAGITVTAPSGFEVSTSAGSGFASSIVVGSAPTVSTTTIYVRLASTTVPNTYSGNVTCASTGATTQNIATASSTVNVKPLTVTGLTGANKVYDANTTATTTGTATLSGGLVGGDAVTLGGSPIFSFANKNIGTGKPITASGYTLSGAQAARYSLSQPTGLTGNITARNLSISGLTANNKVFDGNTTATLSGSASLVGIQGVDAVTLSGTPTATFASSSVGIGIAVSVTGYMLSGADAGNYTLSQPAGLTADITPASFQYRTNGSVTFTSATNWQSSPDGTTWSNASNAPDATANTLAIVVRNGHTATVSASITLDQLTVENGGALQVNTGVVLTIANGTGIDLTVTGTLDIQGTGTLTGAGSFMLSAGGTFRTGNPNGLSAVGLSGTEIFTNGANYIFNGTALQTLNSPVGFSACGLTVNNSAGLELNDDIAITCTLTLQLGDLDLKNQNIDLGTTGTLIEDRINNHLIKESTAALNESNKGGYIRVTNRSTNGTLNQIAGLGIHLANAGTVNIDRYHYEGAGIAGGGVLKNYEITGVPTNATMRIEFAPDELGGTTPNNTFKLFRYNGTNWVNQGGTWTDAAIDYVELSGINAFSPWTTGSGSGHLPIRLVKFEAQRIDNQRVSLNWQTAFESNNKGFEIEQSENGIDFASVGFVDGKGNSNSLNSYHLSLNNASAAYYRLKQIDFDGKFEYSPIRYVEENVKFEVYPNPTAGKLRLQVEDTKQSLNVSLISRQGVGLLSINGKLAEIESILNEKLSGLPVGVYILQVNQGGKMYRKKVVKN